MELRDIRYFVAVTEHQNIARAAETLDLSTTALGKSLRRLEKSIGAKLVQRAPKGVALTTVGAALLARIGTLQGVLNDVRHEAADLAQGHSGHIQVGINTGTNEERLAYAYVALIKEAPGISLTIAVGDNSILSKKLLKGELDVCIAAPRLLSPREFIHEPLYDVPFVVCASAGHRLAKRKQVSLADIADERWIASRSTTVSQWLALFGVFANHGLPQPTVALVSHSPSIRDIVIAYSDHLGLHNRQILLQEMRRFPLVELPVKEFSYVQTMSIIYRKGAYLSPAAHRLIAILKAQAKGTPDSTRRASNVKPKRPPIL